MAAYGYMIEDADGTRETVTPNYWAGGCTGRAIGAEHGATIIVVDNPSGGYDTVLRHPAAVEAERVARAEAEATVPW